MCHWNHFGLLLPSVLYPQAGSPTLQATRALHWHETGSRTSDGHPRPWCCHPWPYNCSSKRGEIPEVVGWLVFMFCFVFPANRPGTTGWQYLFTQILGCNILKPLSVSLFSLNWTTMKVVLGKNPSIPDRIPMRPLLLLLWEFVYLLQARTSQEQGQ